MRLLRHTAGHFFADRAVKFLLDQDMNNCTAVLVDCWSGIGSNWWLSDGLLSFYRVVSGPMTDQNQVRPQPSVSG